jgi:2-beta-glucuronyltransferase
MKITIVTSHAPSAGRKTGFHFWADILAREQNEVDWLVAGYSRLTALRPDPRLIPPPYNKWVRLADHLKSFAWRAPFHPVRFHSPLLNRLSAPFVRFYPNLLPATVKREITDTDLFIVENGPGVMLVEKLARLCPRARFFYNVSDSYDVVSFHPLIPEAERKALRHFDLIRVNAQDLARHFPKDAPVIYLPQAISKSRFDEPLPNPYRQARNAVSVGDMLFDAGVVDLLAERFPDWTFHLFGKGAKLKRKMGNVIEYGERAFDEIAPYILHADIGLAPYRASLKADYISQSSLKLVQYTYCRLPVVAPDFAAAGRTHVQAYRPAGDPEEAVRAFAAAIAYDRRLIDPSEIPDWGENLARILAALDRAADA